MRRIRTASLALTLMTIGLTSQVNPAQAQRVTRVTLPIHLFVPSKKSLEAMTPLQQAHAVAPCRTFSGLLYCVDLGFLSAPPDYLKLLHDSDNGRFAPMGDEPLATWVRERTSISQSGRRSLELREFNLAHAHLDKARAVALAARRISAGLPVASVDSTGVVAGATPTDQFIFIMPDKQTRQVQENWCGPATMQSLAWGYPNAKKNQSHWADVLDTGSGGTGLDNMVAITNSATNWDIAAGSYVSQNISSWSVSDFWGEHVAHLGDGTPAPIIEHPEELMEYFTYLEHDGDGHFQTGRGYQSLDGDPTSYIATFDPWNEDDWFGDGNVTWGPHLVPNAKMLAATKANSFEDIGL